MLRHQNSHCIVNAAFSATLTTSSPPVLTNVSIAYGGVGAYVFRARAVESALNEHPLTQQTLSYAFSALTEDINAVGDSPEYGETPAYRR